MNAGDAPVDIGRWRVENVGGPNGWSYRLEEGARLSPGGFLVVFRHRSRLALVNEGDQIRLVRDDGVVADVFAWDRSPGYDRSWSRALDGTGPWTEAYPPTPGGPNRPGSAWRDKVPDGRTGTEEPPPEVSLDRVRLLAAGTRVRVAGRLTATTAAFGPREAYLGGDTTGIKVYLADRAGRFSDATEGAWALATGVLRDYHGERELVVAHATDLWLDESVPRASVAAADVECALLGEAIEGRLVRVAGTVTETRGSAFTVDDGTGAARVVVRPATSIGRGRVKRGDRVSVTGIAGQYAAKAPWQGGYRLMPRWSDDIVAGAGGMPRALPQTGRGPRACGDP